MQGNLVALTNTLQLETTDRFVAQSPKDGIEIREAFRSLLNEFDKINLNQLPHLLHHMGFYRSEKF